MSTNKIGVAFLINEEDLLRLENNEKLLKQLQEKQFHEGAQGAASDNFDDNDLQGQGSSTSTSKQDPSLAKESSVYDNPQLQPLKSNPKPIINAFEEESVKRKDILESVPESFRGTVDKILNFLTREDDIQFDCDGQILSAQGTRSRISLKELAPFLFYKQWPAPKEYAKLLKRLRTIGELESEGKIWTANKIEDKGYDAYAKVPVNFEGAGEVPGSSQNQSSSQSIKSNDQAADQWYLLTPFLSEQSKKELKQYDF